MRKKEGKRETDEKAKYLEDIEEEIKSWNEENGWTIRER